MKKLIDRGKRSKTLREVKPVKNISKSLQSFLDISPMQNKLQNEDNPSQRNCQNQLSHPGLSHIEQECQENLIQGKIHIQQNSNEGLEYL